MLALKDHAPNQRGFTLVEMLVVVTIISTLVLIVVGVYFQSSALTLKVLCESNINSIRKSIAIYSQTNGSFPPGLEALYPGYLVSRSSLSCPASKDEYDYEAGTGKVRCEHHDL